MPPGRSIITVLSAQHTELTAQSDELAGSPIANRDQADLLTAALTRHLSAERQYLYPAAAEVTVGEIEHGRTLLATLVSLDKASPGSHEFRAAADEVRTRLRQHIHTCETVIFPALDRAFSKADLVRLGNRAETAHESAPSRLHPRALMRPPWNKLTDAAIGAIDKILDAASGRKTYPGTHQKLAGTKAGARNTK